MKKDSPTTFPSSAKKVFEGVLYDIYQWPQRLYDGTEVIYERINRQDTVSIIGVTEDQQIVLIDEEQPHRLPTTSLIAGKIEPGEKPLQTAKRELLEETGYTANKFDLWFKSQPDNNIDWTVYTYIARGCKKISDQKLEAGEKITVHLFSFDQFINFAASDKFSSLIVKIKILEAQLSPTKMTYLKQLFFS